jgi:hypothetical protein
MTDAVIISDRYRQPVTAQRHRDGGVLLRTARSLIILSEAEFDRAVAFVRDEPVKARLQRFPMAPKDSGAG